MSRKIATALDLLNNELRNARAESVAASPPAAVPGRFWFNSTTGKIEFQGDVDPYDPTDRASHTGSQLAATVSDFDVQVRTSRLDQMTAPTADVAFNAQKLTELADGTADDDAVTFGQVQDMLASGGNAPRKYTTLLGDGAALTYSLTHGLGTRDVVVSVYYDADGEEVECGVVRTDLNTVALDFAVPPELNELCCVVVG